MQRLGRCLILFPLSPEPEFSLFTKGKLSAFVIFFFFLFHFKLNSVTFLCIRILRMQGSREQLFLGIPHTAPVSAEGQHPDCVGGSRGISDISCWVFPLKNFEFIRLDLCKQNLGLVL